MHRRIRRLRLTCIREDDARHGRVLLDDALRTASLGDETRLILVRQLDLGEMSARATATHWSRRLEEAFREARPVAVCFDNAEAAQANAVYFANRHEPWLTLAERVAAGRRCHEWFWRAAVPHWDASAPGEELLRRSFRALAEQGGLALTLVLGLRLHAQGVLPALLRCLQPADVAGLRSELGAGEPEVPPAGTPETLPALTPGLKTEAEFGFRWGSRDLRTRWLAAVVIARSATPGGGASPAPSLAAAVLPGLVKQLVLQWTEPARNEAQTADDAVSPRHSSRSPFATPPADHAVTHAGGLFFIIPLLARAGLTRHLQTLTAGARDALPWQVLQLGLRHARTPADDPLMLALAGTPPPTERIGRWLLAAHRHALSLTGLTLRQIIARPALITLSPTHIDVQFKPADADIRIRSAGLDFDPGWVPWLSRVIAYHFSRES